MKVITANVYQDFHCLAGNCPDSCCRQGWEIVIDEEHLALYKSLPGVLGQRVRSALEGHTFRMRDGVCTLLDEDGLCPLVKNLGEEGLCHICHTHPRFIEDYGGVREYHLSLSCPEVQRLVQEQKTPVSLKTATTHEEITSYTDIDPDEYLALMNIRDFSMKLCQQDNLPLPDRMSLLLFFAKRAQGLFGAGKHALCKPLAEQFSYAPGTRRYLSMARRYRLQKSSYFPERDLLLSLEHLTEEFPALVENTGFTCRNAEAFDKEHAPLLTKLLALWLAHYIPKAVCDGRVDSKIRFAVFLTLAVRRLCICNKESSPAQMAGLLAKEVEHSPENLAFCFKTLAESRWHEHFLRHFPSLS